jgi:eukaryotic-like serine/threonine-protein kinase
MRELNVGDRLDQFELTELLARSGMASIFKAVDTNTNVTVALKVPYLQYESDVVFHERFCREEQVGLRLEHPSIVRVLKQPEKSRLYLVMELAEGTSLRALLDAERRLPVEQALDLARQVGNALAYMHSRGVIHRDLKPENVLVGESGQIKIIDFGIALDESARRMTWFGLSATVGTPTYMAPEQINGRRGDARTDIYALGTMLYEMVTGELPHSGASSQAIMRAKTTEPPLPPSRHWPEIDPGLEEIILHAIEMSPSERYQTAAQMLEDLQDPTRVVPRDRSQSRSAPGWLRRVPQPLRIAVVILLILVSLSVLIWLSSRHRGAPEPAHRANPAGR